MGSMFSERVIVLSGVVVIQTKVTVQKDERN